MYNMRNTVSISYDGAEGGSRGNTIQGFVDIIKEFVSYKNRKLLKDFKRGGRGYLEGSGVVVVV